MSCAQAPWRGEVELAKERLIKLEGPANMKYKIQRYSFAVGLGALVVARGYGPLLGILHDLGWSF